MEIIPDVLIKAMRGKDSSRSNEYVRTNNRTGKITTAKLVNKYDGGHSDAQNAQRNRLATYRRLAKQYKDDPQARAFFLPLFERDQKCATFVSFITHYLFQHPEFPETFSSTKTLP